MNERIIAIHQPNFLPWPGYFIKMILADHFVFLDHVQFSKGSVTNRTKVASNSENEYLTIPISKRSNKSVISNLDIGDKEWKDDHLRKIQSWIGSFPFYDDLKFLKELYGECQQKRLADINISFINSLMMHLEIPTETSRSSELRINSKRTSMLSEVVAAQKGSQYISGSGLNNYFESEHWHIEKTPVIIPFEDYISNDEILQPVSIIWNIAQFGINVTRERLRAVADRIAGDFRLYRD